MTVVRPAQTGAVGAQTGVVSGINLDGSVNVRLPALSATLRWGPCQVLETLVLPGETTASAGSPSHSHDTSASPLAVGDNVLVIFANGNRMQPIVLGRLRP